MPLINVKLNITPLLIYPGAHSIGGWVGPRADRGSGRFWRRIFCATTGIRTPDSPAPSLDSIRATLSKLAIQI
jgi:hypothetical protein